MECFVNYGSIFAQIMKIIDLVVASEYKKNDPYESLYIFQYFGKSSFSTFFETRFFSEWMNLQL